MSGRCKACNKIMSEYEMTRKCVKSGEYLDLCSDCLTFVQDDVPTIDRPDLANEVYDFSEYSED